MGDRMGDITGGLGGDLIGERILIVDFGSQVTQLIARRVRESGVYCEIHPFNKIDDAFLDVYGAKAVILSGGPASVTDLGTPRATAAIFARGVPVLGICYGQQTMVEQLGGKVEPGAIREFGRAYVEVIDDCALFHGVWTVGAREQVWMSHGDSVSVLPAGFRPVAVSAGAPFAAIADDERKLYGVQFHPEVAHTPHGAALLAISPRGWPGVAATGRWRPSATRRSPRSASASARAGSSAACRAASIPRSRPFSCTRPSATSLLACSSTPGCCAPARPPRSPGCSAATTTSRWSAATRPPFSCPPWPASPIRKPSAR